MDSWLESMPADVDGQKPWSEEDLLAMGPVPVPGNAGDVYAPSPPTLSLCRVTERSERLSCVTRSRVIWNSLLPHGAGVNRSDASRVVQYCGLSPAGESTPEGLAARRQFHANRTGSPRLGMPPEGGGPTVFHSARARRLAGLEAWPGGLAEAPPHGRLPGAATYRAPAGFEPGPRL